MMHTKIAADQEVYLSILPEVEPSCEAFLDELIEMHEVELFAREALTEAGINRRVRELMIEQDIQALEGAFQTADKGWNEMLGELIRMQQALDKPQPRVDWKNRALWFAGAMLTAIPLAVLVMRWAR